MVTPYRIGIALTTIGAGIILLTISLLPTIDHLSCQRQNSYYITCQLRSYSLLRIPVRQIIINPLKGVQHYPETSGSGYVSRVLLFTNKEINTDNSHGVNINEVNTTLTTTIPLSRYSTSEIVSSRLAKDIDQFLQDSSQQTFQLWQQVPWGLLSTVLAGGLFFLLIGLIAIWIFSQLC